MSEVPFEVLDNFPETGDLSDQSGGDVIDAAKGVRFTIQNVEPKIQKDKETGAMSRASLNVRSAIGALGTDGNGKYAGKNLFAELLTAYDTQKYTSDWWKKQARFPYRQFLKAMGFDDKNPPKVNDAFIQSLKGREFIADIRKSEIRVKDGDGKYVGTGDFKNELANFKSVEA